MSSSTACELCGSVVWPHQCVSGTICPQRTYTTISISGSSGIRNFDAESRDLSDRKYAYSFDYLMHDYMMRTFEPHFGDSDVLELGCYQGHFTKKLRSRFPCVTVVDGSLENIKIAQARAPGAVFVHSEFEEAGLRGGFDAIFLIHTLEHLDDPVLVLKRCREWLKPDGKLFVAVPNAHAVSRLIAVKMGLIGHCAAVTEGEHAHGHRRTYNQAMLGVHLLSAGLGIVEQGGIMYKPLANFQMDRALEAGIIDKAYLDACYEIGKSKPNECASVYAVCSR